MAYDALQPLDNEHVSDLPYWIRQKGEELKTLRIVDAGTLVGYSAGNATGNIPISNGTVNTNLVAQYLGTTSFTKDSFAPIGHVNSTSGHPLATGSANGFLSSSDFTKLSGIATGAEVNQNAFSTVKIDTTDLVAEAKTDTLTVTSGTGITLTPTAASDSFSVALTVDGNGKASHSHVLSVAGTTDGFMSATQASNLATAYSHVSDTTKHYNFGKIVAAGSTFTAETDQDTFTITTGTGISITTATDDSITIALASTANADTLDTYHAGNGTGAIPISNGTVNTNLNADMLDGLHSTSFLKLDGTQAMTGSLNLGANNITTSSDLRVVNGSAAQRVLTGGLLVSNSYTDATNIPANGIYSKGNISTPAQFVSTIATGTAPMTVTSTTVVTNLNADRVDGYQVAEANTASTVVARDSTNNINATKFTGNLSGYLNVQNTNEVVLHNGHAGGTGWINYRGATAAITNYALGDGMGAGVYSSLTAKTFTSNVATGTAPFTVTSTTKVANLNADMLDGNTAGNAANNVPLNNSTLNTGLVAEFIGDSSTRKEQLALIAGANTFSGNNTFSGTNTFSGQIISTNVNPAVFKSAGYKSWIFNNPVSNSYVFAPSTAVNGTTLDTANQIMFSDAANITAKTFTSTIGTGTPPFTVASDTAVSNLNADLLDGNHSTAFVKVDGSQGMTGDLFTSATDGVGYRLWGNTALKYYGMHMSSSTNSTHGGRVSTETTSDYNVYFSNTTDGTNRGWVFKKVSQSNGTGTVVAQIDGSGTVHAEAGFRTKKFSISYNSTEDSLDFTVA